MPLIERFIRGTDNQIKLTLTEDGTPVSGEWTELDILFGGVQLHRTASGDGIELNTSTGILTITPADLLPDEITAVDAIPVGTYRRVQIVVKSSINDDGVVFGGPGSTSIIFHITDKPPGA